MDIVMKKGFTLVELLISVSIIAILVAIGVASYATINKQSRDTKRTSDIEQIRSALEMYRADNGAYPPLGSGNWIAASGLDATLVPTYLPQIPADPKSSQSYLYLSTNVSGGNYYGYCISAVTEAQNPADTCPPATGYSYGVKNP